MIVRDVVLGSWGCSRQGVPRSEGAPLWLRWQAGRESDNLDQISVRCDMAV